MIMLDINTNSEDRRFYLLKVVNAFIAQAKTWLQALRVITFEQDKLKKIDNALRYLDHAKHEIHDLFE